MPLNKRIIKPPHGYVDDQVLVPLSPSLVLQGVVHQTMAGVLGQLADLLHHASEMYTDLFHELSATSQRIGNISARIEAAHDFLPSLEEYIQTSEGEVFIQRGSASFSSVSIQDCALFTKATRPVQIADTYENECTPPPNLDLLNPFREKEGSCLKDYTNPDFFVEEWVAEQKKQAAEARKRRERKKPKNGDGPRLRKANEVVEVTKLQKTRYNQWGEKITDDAEEGGSKGGSAILSREATKAAPRVQTSTAPNQLTKAPPPKKAPKKEKEKKGKGKEKDTRDSKRPELSTSAEFSTAPPTSPKPPPPSAPTASSSSSSSSSGLSVSAPPRPAASAQVAAPRRPDAMPSPSPAAPAAPPPPSAPAPPSAPPAPKPAPSAPGAPPVPKPAPSAPAAPPPPSAPAAPPPPSAPSAPAPPSAPPPPAEFTAPAAPEEKRSNLLQQIQAGMKLKKTEQQERKAPPANLDDGTINVAAILQRRMAMEYSDDEDEGEDGDDAEWEDGSDWEDD